MMDMSFFKTSRFWKEMLLILAGLATGAAAVYYFLLPGKFVLGCSEVYGLWLRPKKHMFQL